MCAHSDFSDRIAASSAELLRLYKQQQPFVAVEAEPPAVSSDNSEEISPPQPRKDTATPPPMASYPAVGYLQVQATAAEMSVPISGALVVVTGGDMLVALGETDESGLSELWTLPAPDLLEFERPNSAATPAFYNVAVFADGYTSVINQKVPLYGTVKSMQEVNMIPLPEALPSAQTVFTIGAPTDLQ